jgi:ribosomal protein L22
MKRIKIRARGRADRITKPMCHIEIKLSNKVQEVENGTES